MMIDGYMDAKSRTATGSLVWYPTCARAGVSPPPLPPARPPRRPRAELSACHAVIVTLSERTVVALQRDGDDGRASGIQFTGPSTIVSSCRADVAGMT